MELPETKTRRKIFAALCAAGFVCSPLLFLPPVQNMILAFGDTVAGHPLTRPVWAAHFIKAGAGLCVTFAAAVLYLLFPRFVRNSLLRAANFSEKLFRKNGTAALCAALAVFLLINIAAAFFHEHWRDEAAAWLIAKNAPRASFFAVLAAEGHPALWFLFLMPFAKAGFPFAWISFLSTAVVFAAAVIFVKEFRLPPAVKILALFSPAFCYFSPVIARSYCLLTLELVLVGAFYGRRGRNPILWGILLAAMMQTHIYLAALSGMLMLQMLCEFVRESDKKTRAKILAGGVIGGISVILFLAELGGGSANRSGFIRTMAESPLLAAARAAFVLCNSLRFSFSAGVCSGIFGLVFFAAAFVILLRRNFRFPKDSRQELAVLFVTLAALFFIMTVYPGGHYNHMAAVFSIVMLSAYILPRGMTRPLGAVFSGLLLLSCVTSLVFTVRDIREPFSNSKAAAAYIRENSGGAVFVAGNGFAAFTAELDGNPEIFWPDGEPHLYNDRKPAHRHSADSFRLWDESGTDTNTIYIFSMNDPKNAYSGEDLELVHAEDKKAIMTDECFYFYKRRAGTE